MHKPGRLSMCMVSALVCSILVLGSGCVVIVGSGCGWVAPATHETTKVVNTPHVPGSPIDVDTENGSIVVLKGAGDNVVITARIRATTPERLEKTTVGVARSDKGLLLVRIKWPDGGRQPSEGASFEITVPHAGGLTLRTTNGAIRAESMSGNADLTTSNGSIKVINHAGTVRAATSNGRVELAGVESAVAHASNGSVLVRLAPGANGRVEALTSNGSIVLEVAEGFDQVIAADTSNGRVICEAASATIIRQDRTSGEFRFGAGTGRGALRTSNGSITIKTR